MSNDAINMRDPIWEICERVNVEPTDVTRIEILPTELTLEVLKRNERGNAYVDKDTDRAACDVLTFPITEDSES